MWKGESPEVRAKYHQKSLDIKAQLLALHPNYRYAPRKSSEIRRRAPRRSANSHLQPGSPAHAQPFQHNAHNRPEVNNMKAGLKATSEITRHIPGAQQFLPPVVAPGWNPYHLLPGATSPAEVSSIEEDLAEDLDVEMAVQQAATGEAMNMNNDQDFAASVEELIDNWDIEADLAQMLAEI